MPLFSSHCFHLKARATTAANSCIGGLYRCGVFLTPMKAQRLASLGLEFLSCNGQLAALAFQRRVRRYALIPRLHYFHHLMVDLLESSRSNSWTLSPMVYSVQLQEDYIVESSRSNSWTLSPMVYSVQLQEDYIGRPSRISRRVSPRAHSLRTLQRVLLAMFAELKKVEKKQ